MNDYSALAQRVSMSVTGIRGCLMLSRDGMVLGAHPEGEAESQLRASWVRFAAVGDPERSYVEFPDQVWAFVRRGGYSAFAVADAGVRPGVLVDLLDQALMMGERDRARDRETMRVPDMPSAPSGKPRTRLHKQEREPAAPPVQVPPQVTSPRSAEIGALDEARTGVDPSEPGSDPVARAGESEPVDQPDPETDAPERAQGREDEPEVDRILLAKEFAGLLQVPKEDDEAST
ncbi:MAG: hypothetical protein M3138_06180 [Actinomycetota bacterium]|nr:hypothetical protein [Actinomycetota bacterium]